MIENDKELEEMLAQKQEQNAIVRQDGQRQLDDAHYVAEAMHTEFAQKMDVVKQEVLKDASQNDASFQQQVRENVKNAAVKLTEVEKDKAEYVKQQVGYEAKKLETKEHREEHQQQEDRWSNRQKRREYHFNGVKPIMTFVGITEPMNLIFLYFFAVILILPFFLQKLIRGTIGVLLVGAEDGNRSKTAKAFIWTLIAMLCLLILFALVYLFLKWQGVDILKNLQ